jgi:tRNA G37 N-methylase TrmD
MDVKSAKNIMDKFRELSWGEFLLVGGALAIMLLVAILI